MPLLFGIIWNLWLFSGIGTQAAWAPSYGGCHFERVTHHVLIHVWPGKRSDIVLCWRYAREAETWTAQP